MTFRKVLLGVSVILGTVVNQSQAAQVPHGAPQQPQAGQHPHSAQSSHGAPSQTSSKSSAQLTPLAQAVLDQVKEKMKHVAGVSCAKPGGGSVNVNLKMLAQDIQNQKAKLQKAQANYIIRYDGSVRYKCPVSVFTK